LDRFDWNSATVMRWLILRVTTALHPRTSLALLIGSLIVFSMNHSRVQAQSASTPAAASASALGQSDYLAHCASCHGQKLEGGFGPTLRGKAIRLKWASMEAFAKATAATMPPADPGGLPQETYRRIAAFVGDSNGIEPDRRQSDGSPGRQAAPAGGDEYASGGVGDTVQNEDAFYRKVIATRSSKLAALKSVDEAMLRNPQPEDWLQWRRTDDGNGFSPLGQITRSNVDRMSVAWAKALPAGTNAITPLVHDGVMFINSAGTVMALDVSNGDVLWRYTRAAEVTPIGPPVSQSKAMAIFEDLLFIPYLDNHIVALNIRTGAVAWERLVEKTKGDLRMTSAPIVVRGKLIIGTAGCIRAISPRGCFIVGLNARTGAELWRFHTVPLNKEPGADTWNGVAADKRIGGGVWTAGTYDPATRLVFFGTGQTYHIESLMLPNGKVSRANSGLYTDTTLALDPDTGKLVWHYQHMARDVWDLDWSFERMLFDISYNGSKLRVVATMGKLGILDVLDARTGKYLFSYDVGMQNLVTGIDPHTGRKITDPEKDPRPNRPVDICPFSIGVRNWPATSYDPTRGLLYVPLGDSCMELTWNKGPDLDIAYSPRPHADADGNNGRVTAIDIAGKRERWTTRYRAPVISAVLATAGGIVFEGGRDREFRALDSETGKIMWKMRLDNIPAGSPISFADEGVQYVAITTGGGHPNDITRASQTPEIEQAAKGTTLWVFKLPSPSE